MRELTPLKGVKLNHEYFGVADIEADKWIDFVVQGFYTKRFNKETQEFESFFKYFKDHNSFFKFLFSKENPVDVIYAHYGGGYDFMFWLKFLLESNNYYIDDILGRGSKLLCFSASTVKACKKEELPKGIKKNKIVMGRKKIIGYKEDDGRVIWCGKHLLPKKLKRSNIIYSKGEVVGYKTSTIQFKDSTAFLPFKLADLTSAFNVEHKKLKYDFSKGVQFSEELVEYLEYDCKGLYEVIEKYREWPLIKKAGASPTMAGQALRVFRTFLKDSLPGLTDTQDTFIRKCYFGGRTEIFKPLYLPDNPESAEDLKCGDINSLYPHVMRNNDFPIAVKKKVKEIVPGEMGFYHVKVHVPEDMYIPPLGTYVTFSKKKFDKKLNKEIEVSKVKKYVFPVGTFDGHWSSVELEYAKSLGVKILEVYKGYTMFNGGSIFKDYIDTLYDMRLESIAKKDGVGNIICKLLMNSLYGRFGLFKEKEEIAFEKFEEGERFHSEIQTKNGPVRLISKDKKLNTSYSNVGIASWVTSLARVLMHKYYIKHESNLYYTDTDSIFILDNIESSSELGKLKEEYRRDWGCFLLPKTYIVGGKEKIFNVVDRKGETTLTDKKVVAKGFGKYGIRDWTIHDFVNALEGSMRLLDEGKMSSKDNLIQANQEERFATFKSAIKKGELLTMLDSHVKGIKSVYNKRRIIKTPKGYDTRPIVLKEGKVVA